MRFEWDRRKDGINRVKHGISFEQASRLFTCGLDYLEIYDEVHSGEEERFIAVGLIARGTIVVVYSLIEDDAIRIMSARMATQSEARRFDAFLRGWR